MSEARGSGDARRLGLVGLGLCGLFRLVAAGRRQRQVGIGVGDGLPLILDIGVEGHLDVVVQQRFEDHEAYAVQVGAGNGDLDIHRARGFLGDEPVAYHDHFTLHEPRGVFLFVHEHGG